MSHSSDEEPVARAITGDRDALTALLQQYAPPLLERLRAQIAPKWQSVLDADDVLQVTLLEAFLRIDTFLDRGPGSFEAWLSHIAKNNLLDAVRSLEREKQPPPEKRIQVRTENDSSWALLEFLGVTSGTPSRQAVAEETRIRLREAVSQLPRDYAHVLTLYDLEGKTVEEVAQEMKRSTGAVYMLRARALDFLREQFGSESQL